MEEAVSFLIISSDYENLENLITRIKKKNEKIGHCTPDRVSGVRYKRVTSLSKCVYLKNIELENSKGRFHLVRKCSIEKKSTFQHF